ncbi:hypothetical protein NDU88_000170 [Pleurodeles waltl]|uniref:Uncharacterized protein n=1 Tax=Pleurodeles waltl TaxID=8319 RepID=A0AAV7SVS1_PLEWA|nr:hypothetical protein NDU88_000170 [Pleurodeles waltl]
MPPKRSVLCRPPRLLPHSMRLSRQYTTLTEPALDGTQTPTEPLAQTLKEPGLGSIQTPTEPLALLRLCFRLCLHTSSLSRFPCSEPMILDSRDVS